MPTCLIGRPRFFRPSLDRSSPWPGKEAHLGIGAQGSDVFWTRDAPAARGGRRFSPVAARFVIAANSCGGAFCRRRSPEVESRLLGLVGVSLGRKEAGGRQEGAGEDVSSRMDDCYFLVFLLLLRGLSYWVPLGQNPNESTQHTPVYVLLSPPPHVRNNGIPENPGQDPSGRNGR